MRLTIPGAKVSEALASIAGPEKGRIAVLATMISGEPRRGELGGASRAHLAARRAIERAVSGKHATMTGRYAAGVAQAIAKKIAPHNQLHEFLAAINVATLPHTLTMRAIYDIHNDTRKQPRTVRFLIRSQVAWQRFVADPFGSVAQEFGLDESYMNSLDIYSVAVD